MRQVFLGSSRDYMVELADGAQLRVVARGRPEHSAGERKVWLQLPPERCRALAG